MTTFVIIISACGVVILPIAILVLYGIIGPPWLSSKMKRFMNFFDYDNALFFPYDHTKPSKDALEEMVELPTAERFKKVLWLPRWLAFLILAVIILQIVLLVLSSFLGGRPGH